MDRGVGCAECQEGFTGLRFSSDYTDIETFLGAELWAHKEDVPSWNAHRGAAELQVALQAGLRDQALCDGTHLSGAAGALEGFSPTARGNENVERRRIGSVC